MAGYNQAVRDRLALERYAEFAKIATEEVLMHISVENTVKKADKASKASKYKPKGASSGICFRFNSGGGLSGEVLFNTQVLRVRVKNCAVRGIVPKRAANRN